MNDEQCQILCVDDEPNVLKALRRLFLDDNYEILTAEGGEQGLEILQENPGVRLVVSDFRMPGMDGVQFLKQVNERWPRIVRIVLSGFADTAAVVGAINEGQIYKFIPKPWNDDELKESVRNAIEVHRQRFESEALANQAIATGLAAALQTEGGCETVTSSGGRQEIRGEHLARHALEYLPFAVVGLDNQRNIILANTKAAEMFKLTESNLSQTKTDIGDFPELQRIVDCCEKGRGNEFPIQLAEMKLYVKIIDMLGETLQGCKLLFISEQALI